MEHLLVQCNDAMFASLFFTKHSVVLSEIQDNIADHIIGQLLRKPAN